ncbi:MAG: magnesium transporter [Candidatus Omnitrophica bacterium]|nr:magnesium transporter [Candidatus Omnitrophota bacterium]
MMKKNNRKKVSMTALFVPEIRALLAEKNFSEVKALLSKIPSVDVAERWHNFSDQEKVLIFKLLSIRLAVEVFEALKFEDQSFLLNNLDNVNISQVLNEMSPDDRANLFKDLPPKVIKKFFKLMKKEEVEDVRELMTYEEGTAGAVMTTDYVELRKEMTARAAILKLQDTLSFDDDLDISSIYVTDNEHRLLGIVELQDLVKAPADMLIKDIMESTDFIKINEYAPNEEAAQIFKRYDLIDAPIVDDNDELIGVITVDDIVDIMDREATKEIYEVGKMTAGEGKIIRYATATVKELVSRRAGWLMFLLVFDFLTGTVLKTFQHTLSNVVALVFFIPMLLDTGGNAGAQSSITVIRGLATGDVTFDNFKRVIKIELLSAVFMGIIVGVMAFVRAVLLQSDMLVAVVVGMTMFLIVLLAICMGISLPLLSKKFGLDPAVLAGPITTSVVDVIGLIIYFKVAQMLLPALQ